MVYSKDYLPEGVLVPTLCFFKDTPKQELDIETIKQHTIRLAKAGIAGFAVHGTTGEPVLLSREERRQVLKAHREALDENGFEDIPIIAGCGVSSTWETIELCNEAAELGASFAMVVAPGYYRAVMTDDVIENFFLEVADNSKIPIVLYNFPGIANGITLDFSLIKKLAAHPNIRGIKLSCGSASTGARLATSFSATEFGVYSGLADIMLHGIMMNGCLGSITGLANIIPKALVNVYDLYKAGKIEEAKAAQRKISLAGELELKAGVPGMRYGCVEFFGYGGVCRRPLPPPSENLQQAVKDWISPIIDQERD